MTAQNPDLGGVSSDYTFFLIIHLIKSKHLFHHFLCLGSLNGDRIRIVSAQDFTRYLQAMHYVKLQQDIVLLSHLNQYYKWPHITLH
jgi:hypothetical protein